MTSVTILMSILYVTVLFRLECYCDAVTIIESDHDFTVNLIDADKNDYLNVFCFVNDDDDNKKEMEDFSFDYRRIKVFIVDVDKCKTTGTDFGIEKKPTVMLRKFGINIRTYDKPNSDEIIQEIYQNLYTTREDITKIPFQKIIACDRELKPALAADDRSDKMIVIYIHHNKEGENEELINQLATLKQEFTAKLTVLKMDASVCWDLKRNYEKRTPLIQNIYPKLVVRKFGYDRHQLFGYSSEKFEEIFNENINKSKDEFHGHLFEVTILDGQRSVNAFRYADNDGDLQSLVNAAEADNKLIVLQFVRGNNSPYCDEKLDLLASEFPNIVVIKVETKDCKTAILQYKDENERQINTFPTFILRAFRQNKYRTVDLLDWYQQIKSKVNKYKDKVTDPGNEESKSYVEQITDSIYGLYLSLGSLIGWRK